MTELLFMIGRCLSQLAQRKANLTFQQIHQIWITNPASNNVFSSLSRG
jgi:hypothetical protein